jgi:hypothetical protein
MSTLITKHNNGDFTDVDLKFHGEGAYRIRKSVLVFFVVRRLGLYELPVRFFSTRYKSSAVRTSGTAQTINTVLLRGASSVGTRSSATMVFSIFRKCRST